MSSKNPIPTGDPLVYEGANVIVPIGGWRLVKSPRAPTSNDKKYPVGSIWVDTATNAAYILTSAPGNWSLFGSSSGGAVNELTGDSGGAILPSGGNITLAGTANQVTSIGSGSTITFSLIGPYTPATFTNHGVLVGAGTSSITALAVGATNSVLAGSTGANPSFTALSTLNTVPNGGTGQVSFTAHGVILGEGTSGLGVTATGATGTVLAGAGASADPTFQSIAALNIVDNTTGTVGSPTTIVANTTYVADQASSTTGFILPASATLGAEVVIQGNGPGGWQIQQNANQSIKGPGVTTTTGTGGSLSSTNRFDAVTLVAVVAGASTVWAINDYNGTLTFV